MGSHVLLNLYGCSPAQLQDLDSFRTLISDVLMSAKAELVHSSDFRFGPPGEGFTYLALLSTSHFSIHTWPEWGSAAIDIFTCGDVNTDYVVGAMVGYFEAAKHTTSRIER